jgi:hypothetical protein
MSNTSGRKSSGKPASDPVTITTNYGAASVTVADSPKQESPVEDKFATLSIAQDCQSPEKCKIRHQVWSGLDMWVCDSCAFETFNRSEADRRITL